MSEFYLQFCTSIDNLTKKEREWIEGHLGIFEKWNEGELQEDSDEYGIFTEMIGIYGFEDEHDTLAFDWHFNDDKTTLWIGATEQGNPDHVIAFAQQFLRNFRLKDAFAFSWATTCIPHAAEEFGGGAAFVTAHSAEVISTFLWCEEKWKAFREKQ